MKLEPRIIPKLFLNFNDFKPQYSYKLHLIKKNAQEFLNFSNSQVITFYKLASTRTYSIMQLVISSAN